MKVLFLTIGDIPSINHHEIYPDLLREFVKHGHEVYIACAREKRKGLPTECDSSGGVTMLKVRIGNITKTNLVERGLSTIMIAGQYKSAIKRYSGDVRFDLVMYSTPPITLNSVVKYIKNRDNAKTYLLLKDIFPQNAVDIGMLRKAGIKGLIYGYFRRQEKKLYEISDHIGCMSEANVRYVIKHNPEVDEKKVEVCPNSVEIQDVRISEVERAKIREKYSIPTDSIAFIYGGNLGKPQDIPYMIRCMDSQRDNDRVYFLVVGSGTEYEKIEEYISKTNPQNIALYQSLPKEDYDRLVAASDVGLIFLDHRFTIPNFPSRILSYMQAGVPVMAVTDANTDIGKVVMDGGFGWWCESDDLFAFNSLVRQVVEHQTDLADMGDNGYKYLTEHYTSAHSYDIIERAIND